MAEYAQDFEYGSYAGSGSAPFNQQGNTTTVEGGGSQFVVEYKYGAEGDAALGGTHVDVQGGNGEFVIKVDGSSGGSTVNIDGGNNKFVVAFENATGGDNVVRVNGGNNQFVVVFDYASGSSVGNVVQVDGSNNQYVVSEDLTAIGGQLNVTGESGGGPVSYIGGQGGSGGQGGYDFSAFGQAAESGGQGGQQGGGQGGGNPFAGGFGGQSGAEGGQQGGGQGGDLASALGQSPFGRLFSEVPGAAEAFGQAVATRSAADEAAGVSNPFGNIAPGQNPFSGLGQGGGQQQQGGEGGQGGGGNPFAGGQQQQGGEGGQGGGQQAGSSAEEGGGAGGNPFAVLGAANPFAPPSDSSDPDYVYDFPQAGQGGSLAEGLAASPFGPLLDLPGYTVENLVNALDGNPDYNVIA